MPISVVGSNSAMAQIRKTETSLPSQLLRRDRKQAGDDRMQRHAHGGALPSIPTVSVAGNRDQQLRDGEVAQQLILAGPSSPAQIRAPITSPSAGRPRACPRTRRHSRC